jgi:hypothetical protein
MRRLRSAQRTVPPGRRPDYRAAWTELRSAVHGAGGHAWLFEDELRPDVFLEFVEWKDGGSRALPDVTEVAAALDSLDALFGCAQTYLWKESAINE